MTASEKHQPDSSSDSPGTHSSPEEHSRETADRLRVAVAELASQLRPFPPFYGMSTLRAIELELISGPAAARIGLRGGPARRRDIGAGPEKYPGARRSGRRGPSRGIHRVGPASGAIHRLRHGGGTTAAGGDTTPERKLKTRNSQAHLSTGLDFTKREKHGDCRARP